MTNTAVTHTQIAGPFETVKHSWSDTAIYDANGRQVCFLGIDDIATEETQDELEADQARVAALLNDAPAARLALDLIAAGVAEVWAPDGDQRPFPLFKVGADWYRNDGTYTDLINKIGWQRAQEALSAARGGV